MGFFKDFKDDLSQAVNELLPEEVLENEGKDNTSEEENESAAAEGQAKETEGETAKEEKEDELTEEDNVDKELLEALLTSETETLKDEEQAVNEKEEDGQGTETEETNGDGTDLTEEITIIAKSTVLTGNLRTDGSLEVIGTIRGDVDCKGKLSVIGNVNGNCSASDVYIGAKRFEGSITSEGNIRIGLGTVIIGDILGTAGFIAGAVKGDIDISGPIVIDSSAVIKGNIKAASIQINNGAVIEGFCSLSYAAVNIDNIFE
ncbi:bactofilin family protein [Anaerocolumna xylanovorans]|uniref:Polymer-forming protein n=1 Tax=Anaerocolumna xylanovorans DSM 12503 TaxID=1121345 RepID=A0A1M7YCC5_9FIRM|nr:polymer-forming cytoskeletal protein [Anaerocolumna xylanovorans]SHO50275.1 Polymer-forming protein [Anaerocolumna xylanovorans DSM 12503]